MKTKNNIVRTLPVAKFFFKDDHTHPVRRTVVVLKNDRRKLTGYEIREGFNVRDFEAAPIKTYKKAEIARINEIDLRRKLRVNTPKSRLNQSTLKRIAFSQLIAEGI